MFLMHYDKSAVLSNIKATEELLTNLYQELAYWEKKENPDWKPAPSLQTKIAQRLFDFFQTEKANTLNASFAHFSQHEIPGSESYDNMEDYLHEQCHNLTKRLLHE